MLSTYTLTPCVTSNCMMSWQLSKIPFVQRSSWMKQSQGQTPESRQGQRGLMGLLLRLSLAAQPAAGQFGGAHLSEISLFLLVLWNILNSNSDWASSSCMARCSEVGDRESSCSSEGGGGEGLCRLQVQILLMHSPAGKARLPKVAPEWRNVSQSNQTCLCTDAMFRGNHQQCG